LPAWRVAKDMQADLFPPEGFRYVPDFLGAGAEERLLDFVRPLPFKPFEFHGYLGNRRIFTFGHKYMFDGSGLRETATIPDWLLPVREKAAAFAGLAPEALEHALLIEYAPGAGIGWHLDRPNYEDIVSISFLAPCALRLRRKAGDTWERRTALVAPRSAYLLHGAVRHDWQHSIAPMEKLRYSVTLRTFREGKGE